MITKKDFREQVDATQTPEELATLIKNTSRDIYTEELLVQISAIKSASDVIELIRSINDFRDDEIAVAFLEKIENFTPSIQNYQELLLLKKYIADPIVPPIILWEDYQYGEVKVIVVSQLIRTCNMVSELDPLILKVSEYVYPQVIDLYWERRNFLNNCGQ